jgi:hypothetical protein
MINNDFVKGECRLCGGHLEFPAAATGQTIPCPHCGQSIQLQAAPTPSTDGRRQFLAVWIVLLGCLVGAAIALFGRHPHPTAGSLPPAVSTMAPTKVAKPAETTAAPATPPVDPLRPGEMMTNSFGITGGKMQNTPGSSLVYILGTVRNLGDHQRFGVKVDYSLFDAAGQLIGHATDYQSEIDPHGEWDFKALVMESKAASAQFSGITEQ